MPFFEIKGHTRQKEILSRAYKSGKMAHSYIFSGPEGVGKKFLAKELAKALNCDRKVSDTVDLIRPEAEGTIDSCGNCHSCESLEAGNHINYVYVEGEKGIIKIEKAREILKTLSYKVDSGKRVVIIDDAHTLNHAAQNALLKTLEEPPSNTVLILVTSRVQDFLTTILSRCQRIQFGALEEDIIRDVLLEDEGIDAVRANAIARLSEGSFKRAFQILDDGFDRKREDYLRKFIDLMSNGPSGVEEVIAECGKLHKDEGLGDFLNVLKSWYRDIAVSNAGGEDFIHNSDFLRELREGDIGFSRSAKAYTMVEETLYGVTPPRYANKQLSLEVLLMTLAGARPVAR